MDNLECSICFDIISKYNKYEILCGHNVFCRECVTKYNKDYNSNDEICDFIKSCPICRKSTKLNNNENIWQLKSSKRTKNYLAKKNKSNRYIIFRIIIVTQNVNCIKILKHAKTYDEAQIYYEQIAGNIIGEYFISKI
jgi:hypothetical protein